MEDDKIIWESTVQMLIQAGELTYLLIFCKGLEEGSIRLLPPPDEIPKMVPFIQ